MELWFNSFELAYLDETRAFLTTTSDEFVDILNSKFAPEIEKIFVETLDFHVKVRIFSKSAYDPETAIQEDPPQKEATFPEGLGFLGDSPSTYVPENNFTFENFIVGSSNKFAYTASLGVANHPADYNGNPLLLYGASGLGKTHLMKAIAFKVKRDRPDFNIVFVKGEDFTNELIRSFNQKTTDNFKEKYRNADMLLIDDIQFIAGKPSTQEEFFHTFNALYDAGKQIVLTSDRPPKDIQHLEDRIRSRFEGGLIVDVQPPDTELRIAILQRKAQLMNVKLSDDVLRFLGENVKSNIRQLEGIIKKLGAYSFVTGGGGVSVDTARNVVQGIITGAMPPAMVADQIVERVSKHFGVSVEDIKGKKRTNEIAQARHVAIYAIRRVTNISLQNTAKIFGRDHTTVLASVEVVKSRMSEDSSFEYEVNSICEEFEQV